MIRCECGGTVELVDGTDPEHAADGFLEIYRCRCCRRSGQLEYRPGAGERLRGCLTVTRAGAGR